jgi:hypothetical protein
MFYQATLNNLACPWSKLIARLTDHFGLSNGTEQFKLALAPERGTIAVDSRGQIALWYSA